MKSFLLFNRRLQYLFCIPIFLWSALVLQAQTSPFIFSETFDQIGVGVVGRCTATVPDSCKAFIQPQNEQWTVGGDFSGFTDSSFFLTTVDTLRDQRQLVASNLNTEVCFVTRTIEIGQFPSVGFTLNLSEIFSRPRTPDEIERDSIIEDLLEDDDYIDVKYVLDGDTTLITNFQGKGDDTHTIINDFGASNVSVSNLRGSSLQIIVCFRNNAPNETFALESLAVLAIEMNQDLDPDCPLRAVLILDESGSICGSESQVRNGSQAFVDALVATGDLPELAVIEFSTTAATVFPYTQVDATFAANYSTYVNGACGGPACYNPCVGSSTNWAAALNQVITLGGTPPDLVIFFTDGNPNVGGNGIPEANNLKSMGIHIYVVGVGGINEPNIQNISGTDKENTVVPPDPPFEEADYIIGTFAELEAIFESIPKQVCNSELQVSKTISENQFCMPDTTVITITVNDIMEGNGIDAQAVMLTDIFNNGYTYISDDGGATTTFVDPTLTWDIGTIPDGGSVTLHIMVLVNADPADHNNTATATAANALDASASISDDDILFACTELEVIKTIDKTEFCPPDTAIFTITINDLDDLNHLDAENVVLTDVLGDGYTYIGNDQGASFVAGTLTWNVPSIPNGGSVQIQITAAVLDEPLDHGNLATAVADNASSAASDSIADGDIIVGCTELKIKKTIFGYEFCPPDTTHFTITVSDLSDPNNLDAKLAVLRDTIKNGYTYISNNRGASFTGGILTWDIGTIPNESDTTITIIVAVNPEPADHANYATVSADNAVEDVRDGFSGGLIHVRCCPKGGGKIGYDQILCGNGNDPDPLVGLADPDWAEGEPLEYAWLRSNVAFKNIGQWTPIPGANQASYDPGPISETTYFIRCVRSKNHPECPLQESNFVTITVGNVSVAKITGPPAAIVCGNQLYTFSTPTLSGIPASSYQWDFGPGENPRYLNGSQVQAGFNVYGAKTIHLTVARNGCVATDQLNLFVTNSPQLCADNAKIGSNQKISDFKIYPNPAKDELIIELPLAANTSGEIQLLQLDGKILHSQKVNGEEFKQSLDLSRYSMGMYFVRLLLDDGTVFVNKVIKQ